MIKIMSVEIDGFIIPSQSVKLNFVESNVICIYGDNGSGKTTFLEILFAVFDRDEDILERFNVNKIIISLLDEEYPIKIEKIENMKNWKEILEKEVEDTKEWRYVLKVDDEQDTIDVTNIKSKYYWREVEKSILGDVSSLFLGIGRGIHEKALEFPRNRLWHFFNNINVEKELENNNRLTGKDIDNLTNKLLEYLKNTNEGQRLHALKNIYLPHIEIDTIENFLNTKYHNAVIEAKERIKESLFKTSFSFFKSSLSPQESINLEKLQEKLIYNKLLLLEMLSSDKDIEIETVFESLEKDKNFLEGIGTSQKIILSSIVEELNSEVELFNEIQNFLNEYNSFLNCKKKLVLSSNGVYVEPENHSIHKLSSGERHLLTFFTTILLMGEEQDFILLDEPEISLDIEWQEKLLSTISKLAPNSQIIVASHSPSIMGNYFDESIEITMCE